MNNGNDAGPRFQMSLQGIPLQIADGKIRLQPLTAEQDPENTFNPTHWALTTETLSQAAIFLFGLMTSGQFPQLTGPAKELLGTFVTAIRVDPESIPRIVVPGAPVGLKR